MDPSEYPKLAYVTQTTLSVDDTKEIALALNKKFPSIENPKKKISAMPLLIDKRKSSDL